MSVWSLRRVERDDVEHVELWCVETSRGPLWQVLGSDPVAERLAQGEAPARIGRDLGALLGSTLEDVARGHAATRVWLGGGLSQLPGLAATFEATLSLPSRVSGEGRFSGERGGFAVLESELGGTGVVVDVGQTAVKASGGGQRLLVERNPEALPRLYIDPARPPTPEAGRRRATVTFIAEPAATALALADAAAMVLALPGPMGSDPVPGPCTYGWEGDRELFPELLAALAEARPKGGVTLLLNDAELAAESARAELRPGTGERVLCVTLGFGPGAAVLAPAG